MLSEEKPDAKVHWDRRRFLIDGAIAGVGGMAAAAIHDGELGGPAQTFRGSVRWQEGTAEAPPVAIEVPIPRTSADQVRLFRSLFRGREDILPTRFEVQDANRRPSWTPVGLTSI
jgi:hypothetical protein